MEFNLKIELYMSSMGHGTAPVKIEASDATNFIVRNAYFYMSGVWDILIKKF